MSVGACAAPRSRHAVLKDIGGKGKGIMQRGPLVRREILLLHLFLAVLRFFNEGVRVKLLGEILDSRDNPRGGPIYSIADHRKAAIADGLQDAPSGKRGEHFDSGRGGFGV